MPDKVLAGERLDFNDGVALYRSGDILAVGWLANHVRERLHGNIAYFNVNRHINPTNVCVAACRLCAFGRRKDERRRSYTMALEEAWQVAASGYSEAVTEFHIVGGLHPDLPFQYFLDLVSGFERALPAGAHQGVHHGRGGVPGKARQADDCRNPGEDEAGRRGFAAWRRRGNFSDRVRHIICDHKIDGDEWLETARTAHKLGLRSNATMLYGHVENDEDRVDHMVRLRAVQDDTGGFQTFIPLAFHPAHTALDHLPTTSGLTDIRQIAVSRLMLDNFSHIKAYWQMMTAKIARFPCGLAPMISMERLSRRRFTMTPEQPRHRVCGAPTWFG